MTAARTQSNILGDVLLSHVREHILPDEATSNTQVDATAIAGASQALEQARTDLEGEICKISTEVAPDVDTWIHHAKTLQRDIDKSRRLASEIVRQAEAEEQRSAALQDADAHADFLQKEVAFNLALGDSLSRVQQAIRLLDQSRQFVEDGQPIAALSSLDGVTPILDDFSARNELKIVKVIRTKSRDYRDSVRQQVSTKWRSLVSVDADLGQIVVHGGPADFEDTLIALRTFDAVSTTAFETWRSLDASIIRPRLDPGTDRRFQLEKAERRLYLTSTRDKQSFASVLDDVRLCFDFIAQAIPQEIGRHISEHLIPAVFAQMQTTWLDQTIPDDLQLIPNYVDALESVKAFATYIDAMEWLGGQLFRDWASNAAKNWLIRRREICLDQGRTHLAKGINPVREVEHTEERLVVKSERTPLLDQTEDWDNGWGSDHEDSSSHAQAAKQQAEVPPDADDGADAWGWGDDDTNETTSPSADPVSATLKSKQLTPQAGSGVLSKSTLTETYSISAMPTGVVTLLQTLLNDAEALAEADVSTNPVAAASGGLLAILNLALAEFRAIAPFYYERDAIGMIYAYNDSVWLCERLKEMQSQWRSRDASARVLQAVQKLDAEIRCLSTFGRRAYAKEMDTQKVVLGDLLAGAQNIIQQSGSEMQAGADAVLHHVKQLSSLWHGILRHSHWLSAVGSLANAIAVKIIGDVFDLTDMSVDEAEATAQLISKIATLDTLFRAHGPAQVVDGHGEAGVGAQPLMAQYADQWLKLQFLSEVLQSNLTDIKWLWFESELSLHFSKDEVVDLIHLSFENNANVRAAIKEITEKPRPHDVSRNIG